jgi:hypothetical protein
MRAAVEEQVGCAVEINIGTGREERRRLVGVAGIRELGDPPAEHPPGFRQCRGAGDAVRLAECPRRCESGCHLLGPSSTRASDRERRKPHIVPTLPSCDEISSRLKRRQTGESVRDERDGTESRGEPSALIHARGDLDLRCGANIVVDQRSRWNRRGAATVVPSHRHRPGAPSRGKHPTRAADRSLVTFAPPRAGAPTGYSTSTIPAW